MWTLNEFDQKRGKQTKSSFEPFHRSKSSMDNPNELRSKLAALRVRGSELDDRLLRINKSNSLVVDRYPATNVASSVVENMNPGFSIESQLPRIITKPY